MACVSPKTSPILKASLWVCFWISRRVPDRVEALLLPLLERLGKASRPNASSAALTVPGAVSLADEVEQVVGGFRGRSSALHGHLEGRSRVATAFSPVRPSLAVAAVREGNSGPCPSLEGPLVAGGGEDVERALQLCRRDL